MKFPHWLKTTAQKEKEQVRDQLSEQRTAIRTELEKLQVLLVKRASENGAK